MPNKRFSDPPINEVVCGVMFENVEALDPVLVGRFWDSQLPHFPKKQLVPAIAPQSAEGLVIDFSPVPALRTWLVSADDSRLMQVQSDRFYLNWRSRGAAYPSFNAANGQQGLLSEVLSAFGAFTGFMNQRASVELKPTGIELTMIDILKQGRHWGSIADLQSLLPVLAPFIQGLTALPPVLQTIVEGPAEDGQRRVVIQRAVLRDSGADAFRVETTWRLAVKSSAEIESGLKAAHRLLKRTFDDLIPSTEHHRFEQAWRPV